MGKFFKKEPWDHQVAGVNAANQSKLGFGFFFEMGTGKTFTTIHALRLRYHASKRLMRTLIFAPSITLDNWQREVLENSNIHLKDIVVLSGPGAKRVKAFEKVIDRSAIVITNYEVMTKIKRLNEMLTTWSPEIMVFDESHRLKNHESKTTKEAIRYAKKAKCRFILTGSPILNNLMDIFAQYMVLDLGGTFGRSFYVFRNTYFVDSNAGMPSDKHFPNWRLREGAEATIREKMSRLSMHVAKAECLDLPPLVRKEIRVTLGPDQAKAYVEMEKQLLTFLDENQTEAAVADLALTKGLRLLQITTGHVGGENVSGEKFVHKFKSNAKKKALRELLEDIGDRKVIIWSVFKENYADIADVCESLGRSYVEVHGGKSHKQKMAAVEAFNNDPDVHVFIGHPGSGGIGINLVASDVCIFYSRSFSLEYDLQAEARNHRGGSEIHDSITRIDLVADGTIDVDVLSSLREKKSIGLRVLRSFLRK